MARDRLKALQEANEELRLRLEEAQDALEAIRTGQVESLVVESPDGPRIFSLEGASHSYRVLVEAMNEGAATLSENGEILYCNVRLAEMLKVPLERVMGSALRDWVRPELQAIVEAMISRARDGSSRAELGLRREDEDDLPVHLSMKAFHDDGRRLLCLAAADLSEQKRNEQVLAEGRLAQSVLEQAAEAIVVCDERGWVTRASRAAEQLCGCSPLRASFDAAFPVVLSSPLLAGGLASTALQGAVTRAEPASLVRVDGSRAQLLVSATPIRGAERRTIGCVITMVDVSEHQRVEEERRAAEERIRTLGDNLPDGAVYRYAHDANGRHHFLYISAGIERLTGVPPTEILRNASALHDTIEPGDRQRLLEAETRSRQALTPLEIEVQQRHRQTGELRWALLRSVPRRLGDGSTVWDGFHFDITARKHAEEALRDADRNKNQFLAMLSHELRNPLMPIRNGLYTLERTEPGGEQAQRAHAVMKRQVGLLARLIDDLLDVTRISRGKLQLEREDLDAREVVERTVEDQLPTFSTAGVSLQVSLPQATLPMSADRARLTQVVSNLLQNAAKFTPRGGHVWLTFEGDADRAEATLRVRDDGCGMDADMVAHLFEPFSQSAFSVDRSRGGLGLGLSLAKEIVELHGGTIAGTSEGPGRGAEFSVRLPLQVRQVGNGPAVSRREPRPQPRRVLIIEDNTDAADSLREVLKLEGHVVETASSGPEGLDKARRLLPEIVLCDIGLPGMDGYQVARAIRADARLRSSYVVALSGFAGPDDRAAAKAAGFDRHLAKPPVLDQLAQILLESATASREAAPEAGA